jgi:hypothetical protein
VKPTSLGQWLRIKRATMVIPGRTAACMDAWTLSAAKASYYLLATRLIHVDL